MSRALSSEPIEPIITHSNLSSPKRQSLSIKGTKGTKETKETTAKSRTTHESAERTIATTLIPDLAPVHIVSLVPLVSYFLLGLITLKSWGVIIQLTAI